MRIKTFAAAVSPHVVGITMLGALGALGLLAAAGLSACGDTAVLAPNASANVPAKPMSVEALNIDPGTRRLLVRPGKEAGNAEILPSALGRGWNNHRSAKTGLNELMSCVKGRVKNVNLPYRTRYRIELEDLKQSVRMRVSATVVHRETELKIFELTEEGKRWKRTRGLLRRNCGRYFVSKVEFGGRLEKSFQFSKTQFEGAYPIDLDSTLEVGDSPAEVALFKSVLEKMNAQIKGNLKSYEYVSLSDSRSGSESAFMVSDFSSDPDLFIKYAEGYKGSHHFPREQEQYIWLKDLPSW